MDTQTSDMVRLASMPEIDEIPEGRGQEFRIGKRFVAIFRYQGQLYAMEDVCPHAGAPLNNGPIQDGAVACLWHAWRFDLRNGTCINIPKSPPVPTYPITIRDGELYITLPVPVPVPVPEAR